MSERVMSVILSGDKMTTHLAITIITWYSVVKSVVALTFDLLTLPV